MSSEHQPPGDTADERDGASTEHEAVPAGVTHKLLRRQLRRAGITATTPTEPQWHALLERVDRAYHQADRNAAVVDHTLAVSSQEMRNRIDEVIQRADERVMAEYERLQLVFGSVMTALVMFDRGGRIVALNSEAERLLGEQHTVVDRHLDEVLITEGTDGVRRPLLSRADLDDAMSQGRWERHDVPLHPRLPIADAADTGESDLVEDLATAGGDAVPVSDAIAADVVIVPFAADDPELGGLIMITDNAEREHARERLAWQASHDPLTGLANRALVTERIESALTRARGAGDWPAVLFLDLDRFKAVNDLLGHAFGDRLLVAVAERLQRCVRSTDTVARLGGDEFAVLCDTTAGTEVVQGLAERLLQSVAEPFDLPGEPRAEMISVTASIGIAHGGPMYQGAEALLHHADLAMCSAKQQGRNCFEVADEQLRVNASERVLLERGLRIAIARHEIGVAYQPVQNTMTGELVGFEALARWVHPVLGDVRPNRFVPVAVETGLIEALGDRMLDLACRDVATWNRERKAVGLSPIVVHVNISGRELRAPNLLSRVRSAMREHAVLPSWIMLEMTESMLLDDPETTIGRLRELKRAGIRVAIDDFGTGYSSLASLRRYPVHMIKIDREFIAELASSKQDQSIVKAMIDLAQGLDHEVLAEGVETNAELDLLRSLGCGLVQGYLLGMPMPSEDALLLATSCRTRTPDQEPSTSVGTAHLQTQP